MSSHLFNPFTFRCLTWGVKTTREVAGLFLASQLWLSESLSIFVFHLVTAHIPKGTTSHLKWFHIIFVIIAEWGLSLTSDLVPWKWSFDFLSARSSVRTPSGWCQRGGTDHSSKLCRCHWGRYGTPGALRTNTYIHTVVSQTLQGNDIVVSNRYEQDWMH